MKIEGFVLRYPLGTTVSNDSSDSKDNAELNLKIDELTATLSELASETLSADEFSKFKTDLDAVLKYKADLRDDTDDGIDNPTIIPEQLPEKEEDMSWEE